MDWIQLCNQCRFSEGESFFLCLALQPFYIPMYLPHQITVLELSIALASRISTSNLPPINTFSPKSRVKTTCYLTPIDLQRRLDLRLHPQVIPTKECNDTTLFGDDVDVIWTLPVAEFQVLNDYEFLAFLTSWDGSLGYPHLILSSDGTMSRRSTERISY